MVGREYCIVFVNVIDGSIELYFKESKFSIGQKDCIIFFDAGLEEQEETVFATGTQCLFQFEGGGPNQVGTPHNGEVYGSHSVDIRFAGYFSKDINQLFEEDALWNRQRSEHLFADKFDATFNWKIFTNYYERQSLDNVK